MSYEEYTPKEVSSIMGLIDTYIRLEQYRTRDDRSYKYYHPSEWGYCLRKQQYSHYVDMGYIKSEFNPSNSQKLRLFDKGHNMHKRWVKYFDEIGNILLGLWKCKNPLCFSFDESGKSIPGVSYDELYKKNKTRVYGEEEISFKPKICKCGYNKFLYEESPVTDLSLNFKGHADTIIDCTNLDMEKFKMVKISFDKDFLPLNNKVVIDFKTINARNWTNQLKKQGPHRAYLIQLTIYTHILGCAYGMLLYENKDTSETMSYMVNRNDKWWEIIKYQAKTMMDMSSGETHLLPPPRPAELDCYECIECEFKSLCKKSSIWDKKNLHEIRRNFYKDLL